jgi:hypothetical protein
LKEKTDEQNRYNIDEYRQSDAKWQSSDTRRFNFRKRGSPNCRSEKKIFHPENQSRDSFLFISHRIPDETPTHASTSTGIYF